MVVCVMVNQKRNPNPNVKYSFGDAIAIMPLTVGWKPTSSRDLMFLDHLLQYMPPNANVLTQSWRPYNAKVYSEIKAAMDLCKTSPLRGIRSGVVASGTNDSTSSSSSVSSKAAAAAEVPTRTSLAAVFDRVKEIEAKITLSVTSNKDIIIANATTSRKDILGMLSVAAGDGIPKKIITGNSSKVIDFIQKYFDLPYWNREQFNGLDKFDSFWNTTFKTKTSDVDERIKLQETNQVDIFLKLIAYYTQFYDKLSTKLSSETEINAALKEYYTKEYQEDEPPNNDRKESVVASNEKVVNEFLWLSLIECFETLNSVVNTYFSFVCATQQKHIAIVENFMTYSILYCISPIFQCIKKVKANPNHEFTKEEQTINSCLSFFDEITPSYKAALDTFFGENAGVKKEIVTLKDDERTKNNTNFSKRIQDPASGVFEEKDEKSLFCHIESIFKTIFMSCKSKHLASYVENRSKESYNLLKINRNPGKKLEIFDALRKSIGLGNDATALAKIVAYSHIYYNTVAYGTFHYKKFNQGLYNKYLNVTNNPLNVNVDFSAEKTGEERIKDPEGFKTTRRTRNEEFRRVNDVLSVGWISKTATLDTAKTALGTIMKEMELKEGFHPQAVPNPPPSQQKKSRPKSAKQGNNNNKNKSKKDPPFSRPSTAGKSANAKKENSNKPTKKGKDNNNKKSKK